MPQPLVATQVSRRFAFQSRAGGEVELEVVLAASPPANDDIKQLVFVCHGRERDAWSSYSQAYSHCTSNSSTLLVAPHFVNGEDGKGRGGNGEKLLVWRGNGWGEGAPSQQPSGAHVSSFEALDALIVQYGSKARHRHLERIVVAGHSLGAQFVQRYAILGERSHIDGVQVSYVVMNPSTYLYTHHDFEYKYGLAGIHVALAHYPSALVSTEQLRYRIKERTVHYMHGAKDNGVGDDRPNAQLQGHNRRERFDRWKMYLLSSGLADRATFDDVHGSSHDADKMMASEAGQRYIFRAETAHSGVG